MCDILYNHGMAAKQNGNATLYSICIVLAANYGSKEAHEEILDDYTGEKFHLQQDHQKSMPIYLATQTYGYSAAFLADMYSKGYGVEINTKLAKKYLKIGCEKNNLFAIIGLANLYSKEHKDGKALTFYEKATAMGHVDSMNTMGLLYGSLKGNFAGAKKLFEAAIEFGHQGALRNLAAQYRLGFGCEIDTDKADKLEAAAEKCDTSAKFFAKTMYKDIVFKPELGGEMEKLCVMLVNELNKYCDETVSATIRIEI